MTVKIKYSLGDMVLLGMLEISFTCRYPDWRLYLGLPQDSHM